MCVESGMKTQMLKMTIKNHICSLEKTKFSLNAIIENDDLKKENDFSANDFAKAALINIDRTINALNQKLQTLV